MLREFKQFAIRGNVIDMAIGIVVGTAFNKIVTSFVNDMLMPPLGLLLGKVDFSKLYLNLSGRSFQSLEAAKAVAAPTVNYGLFLNTVIDFLIVSFAVFLIVRQINRLRAPAEPPPQATRPCPYCLSSIPPAAVRCAHCTSQVQPA